MIHDSSQFPKIGVNGRAVDQHCFILVKFACYHSSSTAIFSIDMDLF